ncbi:hypothetical protein IG631_22169 [Alternaria alternata]|nr:hypothetical protein IG631_22169 [Alternaria alternata]
MSHLIRRTAAELAARHVYRYPPERGVVLALERRVRAEAAHVKADAALFVAPVLGYVFFTCANAYDRHSILKPPLVT